jgi:DNA processing protein
MRLEDLQCRGAEAAGASTGEPWACAACLRRARLLGHLAPYIEGHLIAKSTLDPSELLRLGNQDLARTVAPQVADRILAQLDAVGEERLRAELVVAECWACCRHDRSFPAGLREVADAPWALIGRGDPALLGRLVPQEVVTVVGARRASPYGCEVARGLGRELAEAGLVVVSGLAFGIDAWAHRGALEGGLTVAVLGCGPDKAYPAAHRLLWRQIGERGLVLSELPPRYGVWRWAFPARNRIMAALAGMTVVVEAAEHSGSLITAEYAENLGRDIGAVPGPVGSRLSAGLNSLLAGGACLIRDAQDVLDPTLGPGARRIEQPSAPTATDGHGLTSLLCPKCCSEGAAHVDRGSRFECSNCGALFKYEEALVTVLDAEAHAGERSACTCDDVRGCPSCFGRADQLVGATVRDSQGRVWEVEDVGEKDGFPTISGAGFWDRPDEVEVLHESTKTRDS